MSEFASCIVEMMLILSLVNHHPSLGQRLSIFVAVSSSVFTTQLQPLCLKDVIVLSTRGSRAPADQMSGGDYDGDEAWICWDERLVNTFSPSEPAAVVAPPITSCVSKEKLAASSRAHPPSFTDFLLVYDRLLESNDVVGQMSHWHLCRADWSPDGVFDVGCLHLSMALGAWIDVSKSDTAKFPSLNEYREESVPFWWPSSKRSRSGRSAAPVTTKASTVMTSTHRANTNSPLLP